MTLAKVFIFRFILFSICMVNIFRRAMNCASIASLIQSSSKSFKVLNKVTWSSLRGVSVLSVKIASRIELAAFLVIDLPLIWEQILIKR